MIIDIGMKRVVTLGCQLNDAVRQTIDGIGIISCSSYHGIVASTTVKGICNRKEPQEVSQPILIIIVNFIHNVLQNNEAFS